ncbi:MULTISPECIES: hypothetical protein [Serratia]|uniref:hypothetical protein n=1 Tax=Serratia TaxID=613 RepID=UPI0018D9456F|nr:MULTISPECIES: hypothetical protein [Serratia]MBH3259241.1 hypothetical protein [Serratia marcescens]MDI9266050.1 hypothetical protein [Serratia sp. PF2-63]MDI9266423.1 hypothetical protein [Serratia sp. PF-27]MDP8622994.1 hypothetical protein [Serratia marcescens]
MHQHKNYDTGLSTMLTSAPHNMAISGTCGVGVSTLPDALIVDGDMQRRWIIEIGQTPHADDAAAENSAL